MKSFQSSRRQLIRTAGSTLLLGGVALGFEQPSTSGSTKFRINNRLTTATDLLNNPDYSSQNQLCYLVTETGASPTMEVYPSMDKMLAAHFGSTLHSALAELNATVDTLQSKQASTGSAEVQRMQRAYTRIDAGRQDLAQDTGLAIGSEQYMAVEKSAFSLAPRSSAGTAWEDDNYSGRSVALVAVMPDASIISFDNVASSMRFSGVAMFSDISWYRGSKLFLPFFTIQSIPSLGVYATPHGVSWNDLISSWSIISY